VGTQGPPPSLTRPPCQPRRPPSRAAGGVPGRPCTAAPSGVPGGGIRRLCVLDNEGTEGSGPSRVSETGQKAPGSPHLVSALLSPAPTPYPSLGTGPDLPRPLLTPSGWLRPNSRPPGSTGSPGSPGTWTALWRNCVGYLCPTFSYFERSK
jgi:hypothetical protein